MAAISRDYVLKALANLRDSEDGRSVVERGMVDHVSVCEGHCAVRLKAPDVAELRDGLRKGTQHVVRALGQELGMEVKAVEVEFIAPEATVDQPADQPMKQAAASPTNRGGTVQPGSPSIPGVRNIIAVGAGKGGVGKSTVALNLAVGLARQGHGVGLLDGDIYGPSVPTLLGLGDMELSLLRDRVQPFFVHGIKTMTIGKMVDPEKPLIWRGPMAHGAFKQITEQTDWGELDFLIIDLPPGTGDVPLTMAQLLSLSGAVIVCTPQRVAQDDAVRAARMFQQLNVNILGVVENMSWFIGDDGKEYDIFGRGGAEQMSQRLGLPFLGAIPLNMQLRANCDNGNPTANFTENPPISKAFDTLVERVQQEVALATQTSGPTLTVN